MSYSAVVAIIKNSLSCFVKILTESKSEYKSGKIAYKYKIDEVWCEFEQVQSAIDGDGIMYEHWMFVGLNLFILHNFFIEIFFILQYKNKSILIFDIKKHFPVIFVSKTLYYRANRCQEMSKYTRIYIYMWRGGRG